MGGTISLYDAHLSFLAATPFALLGIAYWVYTRTNVRGRRAFLLLVAIDTLWVTTSLGSFLVPNDAIQIGLVYLRSVFTLTAAVAWTYFAAVYTGRSTSPRTRTNLVVLLLYAYGILVIVTNPVHHLLFTDVVVVEAPGSYANGIPGPLMLPTVAAMSVALLVGLHYVVALFVNTSGRSKTAPAVLGAGIVCAAVPYVSSVVGGIPTPDYVVPSTGVLAFIGATTIAIFKLGMLDVRPVARNLLVDQVGDGLLVFDGNGTLVDYNDAAHRVSPATATSDPVGTPFDQTLPALSSVSLPASGERVSESLTVDDDGETRHYSVQISPLTDAQSVRGYAVILRDITELETYRRKLEHQNERLDAFASTVSHDLRNPLFLANGHGEHLKTLLDDPDLDAETLREVRESVDCIERAHKRIDDIIGDLRTMAKADSQVEETEDVPFEDVVAEAFGTVDTAAASYETESAGTIQADRSRLLSILENLIRNAVEHAGRDVHITFGLTDEGFYVADDGSGIPLDRRTDIFEQGTTYSEGGTGFGLSIVQSMAQSHGWTVRVDPDYDDGARFVFEDATTSETITDEPSVDPKIRQ